MTLPKETKVFLSFPLPDTATCVKCDTDLPIELYLVDMNEPPVQVLWNVCLNCRRAFAKASRARKEEKEN